MRQKRLKMKAGRTPQSTIANRLPYMPGGCDKKQLCARIESNESLRARQATQTAQTHQQ